MSNIGRATGVDATESGTTPIRRHRRRWRGIRVARLGPVLFETVLGIFLYCAGAARPKSVYSKWRSHVLYHLSKSKLSQQLSPIPETRCHCSWRPGWLAALFDCHHDQKTTDSNTADNPEHVQWLLYGLGTKPTAFYGQCWSSLLATR